MTHGSFDSIVSYDSKYSGNRVMVVYGARRPGFLTLHTAHPVFAFDPSDPESFDGEMARWDIEAATIARMIDDGTYLEYGATA